VIIEITDWSITKEQENEESNESTAQKGQKEPKSGSAAQNLQEGFAPFYKKRVSRYVYVHDF